MAGSLSRTLQYELTQIIDRHLEELRGIVPLSASAANPPEDIVGCLQRLVEICQHTSPEQARKLAGEAQACQARVERFLELMNQRFDPPFWQTEIGQILEQSRAWRRAVALGETPAQTAESVWDLIAPAKPDHLEVVSDGVYEAQWWKPVPQMDVYLLKHTEGVVIHEEIKNPKGLPHGLAIRFSVLSHLPPTAPD